MTKPDKDTVVAALQAYRKSYGGVIPNFVVDQMRTQWHIAPRTLRGWVAEADRAKHASTAVKETDDPPKTRRRDSFELTEKHLTTVRSTLNLKAAHALLFPDAMRKKEDSGWVSYPTFARAFKNLPPSIRDGIIGGWDAMGKRQIYLSMEAPHRNHTWHLDHTEADVWVSIRGGSIVRPHVSIVRDNATSMRLAAIAYVGRPNEDSICDLLATAALNREYKTNEGNVTVGGLPVQLVLDNGLEHFAEAVTRGALMLGVVINPTKPHHKNLNGPAESTFNGLNNQLLKGLPGYTKGGDGDDGQRLIAPRYADQVDPLNVMTIESFQNHLDKWAVGKNTTQKMHRLGNQTPLTAWRDDPTAIRDVPDATIRAMMLRSSTGRVVNPEGIRFRGIDYTDPALGYYRERGLKLRIGYLMRETRFVEVFDGDTWVCRAINRKLLTESQRRAILLGRERDLELLKRVNAAANQERAHRALTDDSATYDENEELDPTALTAVDDAIDNVTNIGAGRTKDGTPTAEPPASDPPEHPTPAPVTDAEQARVDPTTPTRRKRQPAPSRTETDKKRAEKKANAARERIARRPGTNFGEEDE